MLPRRIVIATHNPRKAVEMTTILAGSLPEALWVTLADFPGSPEPEEVGHTYAENAYIKAEAAAAFTGEWAVADDAGLEIDALHGAPGLYSKRFGGEELSFPEKIAKILLLLAGIPESARSARFRCAVALARPGQPAELFEATCDGRIARAPAGVGGFGYDPIFFLPELGCTMAELTASEKHAVSHRGKVLALVSARLAELTGSETLPFGVKP
ncbi:MAG: RdgB/HAM1 family non-canonical purine NTP pyrophosphatase [Fimbriimonadaceae bacterium]